MTTSSAAPRACSGWTVRLACTVVLGLFGWSGAAEAAPDESAVQAAFVLNFAKFTEWPPASLPGRQGAMQLCQFGVRDELMQAFRALEGRPLQGVPIQWRKVTRLEEVRGCHVLFMAESGLSLANLGGWPVLTVSDLPGFAQQGGMIGLVRQSGRLRFEVNRGVAQSAGLRLSADLLSLAMTVLDGSARREGTM
ncbi:YfiR family protein [Sphaerotilus sp.]|uniref:YfiR family protein n=1 Tax=Sphaerotilus sp. TaxID=2093942 RepID=UPI0034E24B07